MCQKGVVLPFVAASAYAGIKRDTNMNGEVPSEVLVLKHVAQYPAVDSVRDLGEVVMSVLGSE